MGFFAERRKKREAEKKEEEDRERMEESLNKAQIMSATKGQHKEALKIIDKAFKEYPEDLGVIYVKALEHIAYRESKKIEKLFSYIKKLKKSVFEDCQIKIVEKEDALLKDAKDVQDLNTRYYQILYYLVN